MTAPLKRYGSLPTEKPNPRTRNLDRLTSHGAVLAIHREDAEVPKAVWREAKTLAKAVDLAAQSFAAGRDIVFVGAGTSGRLGVLEAAECPPTFGTSPSRIRAIMAGGRMAVFRSKEGAEDDPVDGARQIRKAVKRGDCVVGIAASGVTPFVLGALKKAKALGCKTVLITSNPGSAAKPPRPADVIVSPRVGPEALTGSTRMKCGSAAKMTLNALTTAAMVRMGKVYGNFMVDVRPTSKKLVLRSLRLVMRIARVSEAVAREELERNGWQVKTAIVSLEKGVSPAVARKRLAAANGFLRTVLEARGA